MSDQPTCGYGLAEGRPCRELRDVTWCPKHQNPVYVVCSGCTGPAVRECPHGLSPGNPCRVALCPDCMHLLDDTHGPMVDQPFAPPLEQPGASPDMDQLVALRMELTEVVKGVLVRTAQQKLIIFNPADPAASDKVAAKIMEDLPTHVLFKILSAMGGTP